MMSIMRYFGAFVVISGFAIAAPIEKSSDLAPLTQEFVTSLELMAKASILEKAKIYREAKSSLLEQPDLDSAMGVLTAVCKVRHILEILRPITQGNTSKKFQVFSEKSRKLETSLVNFSKTSCLFLGTVYEDWAFRTRLRLIQVGNNALLKTIATTEEEPSPLNQLNLSLGVLRGSLKSEDFSNELRQYIESYEASSKRLNQIGESEINAGIVELIQTESEKLKKDQTVLIARKNIQALEFGSEVKIAYSPSLLVLANFEEPKPINIPKPVVEYAQVKTVAPEEKPKAKGSERAAKEVLGMGKHFQFVRIEPGTFNMGSGSRFDREGRQVTLTKPFEMQTTEFTQGNWEDIMGFPFNERSQYRILREALGRNKPLVCVQYRDIQWIVEELNRLLIGGCYEYRLPTEAEWEYAARAGYAIKPYYRDPSVGSLITFEWFQRLSREAIGLYSPAEVALKKPNPWGLYDMLGNVAEFVKDGYVDLRREPEIDPEYSFDKVAVVKGAALDRSVEDIDVHWSLHPFELESLRHAMEEYKANWFTGFRLVRVLKEKKS